MSRRTTTSSTASRRFPSISRRTGRLLCALHATGERVSSCDLNALEAPPHIDKVGHDSHGACWSGNVNGDARNLLDESIEGPADAGHIHPRSEDAIQSERAGVDDPSAKWMRFFGSAAKPYPAVPSVRAVVGAMSGVHRTAKAPGTCARGPSGLFEFTAISAQY